MYASSHHPPITSSYFCRWAGRVCGIVLFVCWAALVALEVKLRGFQAPRPSGMYLQAAALAIVFAGYAVGWKRELAGGLIVILGAVAFVLVALYDTGRMPEAEAGWFAAPGLLYLLARYYEHRERRLLEAR